jgi:hypothetical protein
MPITGTAGAQRKKKMEFRANSENATAFTEHDGAHSEQREQIASTQALCAAHSRAYRRYSDAMEALARIDKAQQPTIMLHVLRRVEPNAGVFPPLTKGEFRTSVTQMVAWSHEEIDDFCARYIKVARRAGKWSPYFNARSGRLDEEGVFHELGSADCPKEGQMVCEPTKKWPAFDAASLAEYRKRIPSFHDALAKALAIAERQNAKTGWTKANETWLADRRQMNKAWVALLQRISEGTRADLARICAHLAALRDRELRRLVEDDNTTRFLDEVEREFAFKAQDIIEALRRPMRGGRTVH